MQPIHQLLARIRWDAEFSRGRFAVGFWDRVARKVLSIELRDVVPNAVNPSLLDFVDGEGVLRSIPLHRVRRVWRDGILIWERGEPENLVA